MSMTCSLHSVSPDDVPDWTKSRGEDDSDGVLELEKAWHGLHFLLNGDAWSGTPPLDFLVAGGQEKGDDDGDVRILAPYLVEKIQAALAAIDEDELWSRFDRPAMVEAEIYPNIWDEDEEELHEEYVGYYLEMKAFIESVTASGNALIVTVS
jgi:hypothetical protein